MSLLKAPLPLDAPQDILPGVLLKYDIPDLVRVLGPRVTATDWLPPQRGNPGGPQWRGRRIWRCTREKRVCSLGPGMWAGVSGLRKGGSSVR